MKTHVPFEGRYGVMASNMLYIDRHFARCVKEIEKYCTAVYRVFTLRHPGMCLAGIYFLL